MVKCKPKKSWVDIEMEHAHHFPKNKRRIMAKKIVADHIGEMGCEYYPSLMRMEKKLTKLRKTNYGKKN